MTHVPPANGAPDPTLATLLPTPQPPRRTSLGWLVVAALVTLVLAGVAVLVFLAVRDTGTVLEQARTVCKGAAQIGNDGRALLVHVARDKFAGGDTWDTAACYLKQLKVPADVAFQIENTRPLDGQRSAEWDGIKASWIYHMGERGFDMILTLK